MISIRTRILFGIGALQLAVALISMSLVTQHTQRESLTSLDANLDSRASALLALIQVPEEGNRPLVLRRELLALSARDRFRLTDSQNQVVAETPGWSVPDQLPDSSHAIFNLHSGETSYRALLVRNAPILDSEEGENAVPHRVVLLYAIPTVDMDAHLRQVSISTLIACVVMLAVSLMIAFWVIHAGLKPLGELASQAAHLDAGAWEFTPPESARRVPELQPLSSALDDLIKRLKSVFEHERRMFGDAAHEFKTAIAIVKSTLQLALQSRRTEYEYRERLVRALEDTARLERLTFRMLELAVIEDPLTLQSAETEVMPTLDRIANQFAVVAEASGLHINLVRCESHSIRIAEQDYVTLVSNLLENAIQHSKPGQTVELRVLRRHNVSELIVQDFGEGIPAETLPHIFDRFFRTDQSRSRASGGFGLGLTIVQALVLKYRGTIGANSKLGYGTTFTTRFPICVGLGDPSKP